MKAGPFAISPLILTSVESQTEGTAGPINARGVVVFDYQLVVRNFFEC